MNTRLNTLVASALLVGLAGGVVRAQSCPGSWITNDSVGPRGAVFAMTMWDSDGAGPLPPRLVVGGYFTSLWDGRGALHICSWEPTTGAWSPLQASGGVNNVTSLLAARSGDLIASGSEGVWRLHANAWTTVGWFSNASEVVEAQDGSLFVGGEFSYADGVPARNVARWNGTTWSALGAGLSSPSGLAAGAYALSLLSDGRLVAGGKFRTAGDASANNIAIWDGSAWSPMGDGVDNNIWSLAVLPGGDVVAGGYFLSAGGVPASHIARWNGSNWSAFGDADGTVIALRVLANGDLIAGGTFMSIGGVSASGAARWDGSSWSALGFAPLADGSGSPYGVYTIEQLPDGDIAAGGVMKSGGRMWLTARNALPTADFDRDGSPGTNSDIEAFFACLAGNCCAVCGSADFDGDGDAATDADIEAFFRVLAGGNC